MDESKLLISLSERGRFWNVDFDQLTPPEKVFRAIWELEGDINNGGFDQYFFNSSGDTAFHAVQALTEIGAIQMAGIVSRANQLFPSGSPPRDRTKRQWLLDAMREESKSTLARLDEEFFSYPDNLTSLLFAFVQRHKTEIEGAIELGI